MPSTPHLILNVEDDGTTRSAVTLLLRHAGYEVQEAATGAEALRLAGAHPDLVLLDLQLPDIDGFEVCRQLRADPVTATSPVLLVSGHFTNPDDVAHGLEGGAGGFLAKPVEPLVLVAHVRALLRLKRAEEEMARLANERGELLRRLQVQIDRMPLGYILLDADSRIADWNHTAERIFGYAKEEIVGLGPPWDKLVPASFCRGADDIVRRLRAGDMGAHSVNDNLTKGGRTITCEWYNGRSAWPRT